MQIHSARLDVLFAAERKDLPRELRRAFGRQADLAEVTPLTAARGQLLREQIGEPGDDREQVVEVVRDAAGKLADRLHLLGLSELSLELKSFGDVANVEHDAANRGIAR